MTLVQLADISPLNSQLPRHFPAESPKSKLAHFIRITRRDKVEPPITD
jgi:TfoX N-terminal domain